MGELIGAPSEDADLSEGFVDYSGMIEVIPSDLAPSRLVRYPDEASALEAMSDGHQHLVPGVVAEIVVDGLEAVQVHVTDRQEAARVTRRGDQGFETFAECEAVGQLGKGIVPGEVFELLRLLPQGTHLLVAAAAPGWLVRRVIPAAGAR